MYSKQLTMLITTAVLLVASSVQAMTDTRDSITDKTKYRSLIREIKLVETDYAKAQNLAVNEVKRDGGASLETKSRLQNFEGRRNRIMDRLLMLSLRYGWDIPDRNMPIDKSVSESMGERDRIFASADEIIKKKFVNEAREIASRLKLPLISIKIADHGKKPVTKGGEAQ
jgi:hypothetical protein